MYSNKDFILSTAGSLGGYHIIKQCGVVCGETIFRHALLSQIGAKITNSFDMHGFGDAELTGSLRLIEKARQFALQKMIDDAKHTGANAIISMKIESSTSDGFMHIFVYGTAVKVIHESEYERFKEEEKQKRELAQKEQEERKIKITHYLEKLNENGEITPVLMFLGDISSLESIVEINQLWEKYELDMIYPDIDKTIKKKVRAEKSYGKSIKETEIFIDQLKLIFGKEDS